MLQPREIHPRVTVHITHTTIGRMFLLKPDEVVNQVMLFCLFRSSNDYPGR